jgi:flagellar motility protein MotE (MotC chaperone)
MKLSLKDFVLIVLIAMLSFPITYVCVLYFTGIIKIEYKKPGKEGEEGVKTMNPAMFRDSLSRTHMKTFQAVVREQNDLQKQKEQFAEQQERLVLLQQELQKERAGIADDRKKLEKLIGENEILKDKKIKQLARVYGAMRPAEAARILESLDDNLIIKILNGISDDRQRAKMLAALSNEKAARISQKMGK